METIEIFGTVENSCDPPRQHKNSPSTPYVTAFRFTEMIEMMHAAKQGFDAESVANIQGIGHVETNPWSLLTTWQKAGRRLEV